MTIRRDHDNMSVAANSAVKESAWRMASNLLFALTIINVGAVMLTASTFSTLFMITTIVNIALALGLRQMQSWGRILTVARCLLGIALAVAVAATQGAYLDAVVTTLLLAGIALPILGPPRKAKSLVGAGLFTLGGVATVIALLSSLVAVG
ncbi:MAG: hypothetical protein M9927_13500 [Anaerolineae bacterium]|nr:hypothetical protein [Anaerolineae bacterium]